jgi:hypothetical protein
VDVDLKVEGGWCIVAYTLSGTNKQMGQEVVAGMTQHNYYAGNDSFL